MDGPRLDVIRVAFPENTDFSAYPFSLDIIKSLKEIRFPTQVTFIVGENGSGKSTILEAIATKVGFGKEGGSKHINFSTSNPEHATQTDRLASAFTMSWRMKPMDGYFFRAESFFNVASYVDSLGGIGLIPYGGKSLHEQSHGEGFLAFFNNRVGDGGFYIFDEPEAALSPQRQLALLGIIYDACKSPDSQFVIATHSPILLAYPGATIYSCDGKKLTPIKYKDTKHYEITKGFLDNPEQYMRHLFS
jgi:predicted ATPase